MLCLVFFADCETANRIPRTKRKFAREAIYAYAERATCMIITIFAFFAIGRRTRVPSTILKRIYSQDIYIYIYTYFVLFVKCWFELTFIYIFIIHSNYFQINGYFYCLHTLLEGRFQKCRNINKNWYTIISVEAYIISSYKRFQVRDEARRRCII